MPTASFPQLTIPSDENTLGLGDSTLALSQFSAGAVMSLTTMIIVPLLGNAWVNASNGGKPDRKTALHPIMPARLMIALVIPFCAVLVLNQNCNAQWMTLWKPAHDKLMYCSTGIEPTLVVTHDQVYTPDYQATRCPRAVVDTLGTLIFEKQIFVTFIGVPMTLLVSTP